MTDNNQQSQYNHCLLTSSFPSSDKLFLLMMNTMVFLSNPLVTTILHCKSLKPTLLLQLLCIPMFVGPALCIQTTFIVPHPWKYLISIFFLFILGAAAQLTTNCNYYTSSAKYFVLILSFKRSEILDLSNYAVLPDLSEETLGYYTHNNSSCQDLVPQCTTREKVNHLEKVEPTEVTDGNVEDDSSN